MKCHKNTELCCGYSFSFQYNIDHHGSSNYGGDGVEGKKTARRGEGATEIANEGGDGSCYHRHRHLYAVVARAEYHLGDMGHGKTDEGYRTTERSDYCRQQTGDDEQTVADAGCVDTEVFGITFSQLYDVKRFDEK